MARSTVASHCKMCGETFYIPPAVQRRGHGIYCSVSCRTNSRTTLPRSIYEALPFYHRTAQKDYRKWRDVSGKKVYLSEQDWCFYIDWIRNKEVTGMLSFDILKECVLRTSHLELDFSYLLDKLDFPKPETQHCFHPTRMWRLDFAYLKPKIAVEIHGGIWSGGRHTHGSGFIKDREKMNEAQALGWRVYELTWELVSSGKAFEWLGKELGVAWNKDLLDFHLQVLQDRKKAAPKKVKVKRRKMK